MVAPPDSRTRHRTCRSSTTVTSAAPACPVDSSATRTRAPSRLTTGTTREPFGVLARTSSGTRSATRTVTAVAPLTTSSSAASSPSRATATSCRGASVVTSPCAGRSSPSSSLPTTTAAATTRTPSTPAPPTHFAAPARPLRTRSARSRTATASPCRWTPPPRAATIGAMQPGTGRQVRKPTFTWRELAVLALAPLCVVGQLVVYRGPDPDTAARVVTVLLGLAAFGSAFAFAAMILRRERAARRASAGDQR